MTEGPEGDKNSEYSRTVMTDVLSFLNFAFILKKKTYLRFRLLQLFE